MIRSVRKSSKRKCHLNDKFLTNAGNQKCFKVCLKTLFKKSKKGKKTVKTFF